VDAGTSKDSGVADTSTDIYTPPPTCGDASTGTGAPFPAVSTYSGNDGGFGPALVTRNTGDSMLGTDKVAVFRPAAAKYGQGGVTHPLIVWGNGSTNTVDLWSNQLSKLATYGFVVIAPEQTMVTAAQMNAAMDYGLRLATDPAGGDCGRIDTTKLGVSGYSLGGQGAITVGSNARIKATFLIASSNNNVTNIKAPFAGVFAENDMYFAWSSVQSAIMNSAQAGFGAMYTGGDHNSVAFSAPATQGQIAFFRWRFMGDTAGHSMFVGASCGLCTGTNSAIGANVKTSTWDSL